jgi:hypothetical protein
MRVVTFTIVADRIVAAEVIGEASRLRALELSAPEL